MKRDRRFAAVRHLADLYDRYAVHRPPMLLGWAAGDDLDGDGDALPDDARWQAELWRRSARVVGQPSPAERAVDGCAALAADPDAVDLPDRLCLFGLTRLPASYLDVLRALAVHRDVHVLALHPSPATWGTDDLDDLHHPLLRAWGRDSHEMQPVLRARLAAGGRPPPRATSTTRSRRPSPPRCSSASRPPSAPTSPRPPIPTTAPSSTPTTAPSRSTPATAAPARPRSSATPSPTCSPTTPPSSPATSS